MTVNLYIAKPKAQNISHFSDNICVAFIYLYSRFFLYSKGSTSAGKIASLLQALPFSVLLWQVLGEAVQGAEITPNGQRKTSSPDMSSLENTTSSLLHNSWIQSLLVTALEKEPLLKTVPLCCHILMYLYALKTKLVIVCTSAEDEDGILQSAIRFCFQLLQCLLQRLVLLRQKVNEGETSTVELIYDEEQMYSASESLNIVQDSCKPIKRGFYNVDNMYYTVLHHPVILNCFLWKTEQSLAGHATQNVGTQLTYNVSNLLLAVLPSLTVQQKKIVMAPFVSKICKEGMLEIETAHNGNGN